MVELKEDIWTEVLVRDLKTMEDVGFLSEIPDVSRCVKKIRRNDEVVYLDDVGADPEVVVSNITYPVGITPKNGKSISISLDAYTTEATVLNPQDVERISHEKIRLLQANHKSVVMHVKRNKAIHALAPVRNTATTPILKTTGPCNSKGRRRLAMKDLLKHKAYYDAQDIPSDKRILVLTPEHYEDLMFEATKTNKTTKPLRFDNTGLLTTSLFGFKTFVHARMPYFEMASHIKKSFGAVVKSDDVQASVSFYAPNVFRVSGLTKICDSKPAKNSNFWQYHIRHHYMVLPRKQRAIGAIISDMC